MPVSTNLQTCKGGEREREMVDRKLGREVMGNGRRTGGEWEGEQLGLRVKSLTRI